MKPFGFLQTPLVKFSLAALTMPAIDPTEVAAQSPTPAWGAPMGPSSPYANQFKPYQKSSTGTFQIPPSATASPSDRPAGSITNGAILRYKGTPLNNGQILPDPRVIQPEPQRFIPNNFQTLSRLPAMINPGMIVPAPDRTAKPDAISPNDNLSSWKPERVINAANYFSQVPDLKSLDTLIELLRSRGDDGLYRDVLNHLLKSYPNLPYIRNSVLKGIGASDRGQLRDGGNYDLYTLYANAMPRGLVEDLASRLTRNGQVDIANSINISLSRRGW